MARPRRKRRRAGSKRTREASAVRALWCPFAFMLFADSDSQTVDNVARPRDHVGEFWDGRSRMKIMVRISIAVVAVLGATSLVARAEEPKAEEIAACDHGKGQVCLDLGVRYFNGERAPADATKAVAFYLKACKLSVAKGCGFAGTLTIMGTGIAKDEAKGRTLREKACDLKDGGSCNDLGTAWSEGKGGAPSVDHVKARRYYDKACKLDDGLGCFNLGNVYRLGEGVKADVKLALDKFKKSCDLDAARGCTELAIIYYEGKAAPKDQAKAISLLEKACKLKSDAACKNLELLRGKKPWCDQERLVRREDEVRILNRNTESHLAGANPVRSKPPCRSVAMPCDGFGNELGDA